MIKIAPTSRPIVHSVRSVHLAPGEYPPVRPPRASASGSIGDVTAVTVERGSASSVPSRVRTGCGGHGAGGRRAPRVRRGVRRTGAAVARLHGSPGRVGERRARPGPPGSGERRARMAAPTGRGQPRAGEPPQGRTGARPAGGGRCAHRDGPGARVGRRRVCVRGRALAQGRAAPDARHPVRRDRGRACRAARRRRARDERARGRADRIAPRRRGSDADRRRGLPSGDVGAARDRSRRRRVRGYGGRRSTCRRSAGKRKRAERSRWRPRADTTC